MKENNIIITEFNPIDSFKNLGPLNKDELIYVKSLLPINFYNE